MLLCNIQNSFNWLEAQNLLTAKQHVYNPTKQCMFPASIWRLKWNVNPSVHLVKWKKTSGSGETCDSGTNHIVSDFPFTQCLINIRTRISYNDTRKDNFWLDSARETLQVCDRVPAIMYAVVAIPLIHNIHRDLFAYIRVCTMHLHKAKDFHQLPLDRVE